MADTPAAPAVSPHGSHRLPAVDVDSYNVELKDDEGFIGDRASKLRRCLGGEVMRAGLDVETLDALRRAHNRNAVGKRF